MFFLFRWVVRPLLTFTLGLAVFLAVGILTVDRLVSDKLLNVDFYADVIAEQDTYNRIYDEVMLDTEVRQASAQLFPTGLVSHEDLVGIFRDVAPPEYLRAQVEGVIDTVIGYLREDDSGSETDRAGELRIYVDLGPAVARVKPVAAAFVQRRIGEMPEEEPQDPGCSPDRAVQLWERYAEIMDQVRAGRSPTAIPSAKALTEPCREFVFDAAFGAPELTMPFGGGGLLAHAGLDARIVQGLQENEEAIRAEFVAGDMREALKAAAPALEVVVEQRIDHIPEEELEEAPDCSPSRLAHLGQRYSAVYRQIAAGEAPASIPSAGALSPSCRESVFATVFGSPGAAGGLLASGGLDPRIIQGLEERQDEIREAFVAGDTREALRAAAPVAAVSVGQVLDRIPEEDPGEPGCSPDRLVQAGERYAAVYDEIVAGGTPASIPSAKMLSRPCREFVFDAVFGAPKLVMPFDGGLLAHAGLDPRVVRGLQEGREQIRTEFVAGNMREALKAAAPAVAGPVLDDEIERFRAETLDDDRLELIDLMGEPAASDIRAAAAEFRRELGRGRSLSLILGLGLLVGSALGMLLLHLPDLARGLRRVGVCLAIAGIIYFAIAKLVQSVVPDRGADLLDQAAGGQADIPESAMRLVSDLLVSFTSNLARGLDDVAIPVLIAGAAVFAASFFVPLGRRLVSRLRE